MACPPEGLIPLIDEIQCEEEDEEDVDYLSMLQNQH